MIIADFGYVEGGAAKVALDSVRLLHEAGYKVVLFCGSERVDPLIDGLGIKIEKLGMYELKSNPSKLNAMINGIWNRTAAARLKECLTELDPKNTIVHIHSWTKILSPAIFSVLRKSGFRTVMTCHDYFLLCPNGAFFNFQKKQICHCKGGGLRCLLCNCDARSYLQKAWRWIRQQVVSYQLLKFKALKLLTISALNEQIFREALRYGWEFLRVNNPLKLDEVMTNTDCKRGDAFVYVGRISPEKGPALFAQAISECGVKGVMAGDGPMLEQLKGNYPNIKYLGWVSSDGVKRLLMTETAVLVFPSPLYECSPLSPLEAMRFGVPCIISDATAAVEYIEDGKTGLLFKSGDVEDLKRKIEQMQDPQARAQFAANIRSSFDADNWSEAAYIERLNKVYEI